MTGMVTMVALGVIEVTDENFKDILTQVRSELNSCGIFMNVKGIGTKKHQLSVGPFKGPKGGRYGRRRTLVGSGTLQQCCVKALKRIGDDDAARSTNPKRIR